MKEQIKEQIKEKNPPPQQPSSKILFKRDEFDIESYNFKPLTKGLGFHGEKERPSQSMRLSEVKLKTVSHPTSPKTSLSTSSQKNALQSTPSAKPLSPHLMSGIDAIYKKQKSSPEREQRENRKRHLKTNLKAKRRITKAPSLFAQGASFIVDLLLIAGVTIFLFASFYTMTFKEINVLATYNFLRSSWDFFAIFFALTYLTYFSVLLPLETVGQKLFSISARDEKDPRSPLTIKQSFTMALMTLLSLPLLFAPMAFDFHTKISGIKICKK